MRTCYSILAAAMLLFAADMAQASCGSQFSFCTANSARSTQGERGQPGLRVDLHREYPWNFTRRGAISFGLKVPPEERELIPWPLHRRMRGVQLTAGRFAGLRF
jgi:hypothetical protein